MTVLPYSNSMLLAILPEILLVILAFVVLGLDLLAALLFSRPAPDNALIFGGMLRADFLAFVFRLLFLFAGMIVALLSLDAEGVGTKGEYYAILIGAVLGMSFMA